MNKKAQSQIITTVLIILLVLAAIVIVWQVVNRTVSEGGEEISSQTECLGLTMDITVNGDMTVTIKPTKEISAWRVYSSGTMISDNTGTLGAYVSATTATGEVAVATETVTAAGKIGEQWCPGMNEVTA